MSITEIESPANGLFSFQLPPLFVTYILLFSESNAMELGPAPTVIVEITPSTSANASGGE